MGRPGWTLTVVCAATALLLLDVTVVNVALPAIQDDLSASFTELQWIIDAYALTLAATLLAAGSLADRSGRRAVFEGGLVLFAAASVACALAPSAVALDVARGAQGVGAAAMFATSLALLAGAFEGPARGRALGIWGAVSGAAIALGPLAGGALVEWAGWEAIFWLNLPATLLLLAVTRRTIAESRDPAAGPPDLAGLATFGPALFLLVFALLRGNAEGWTSVTIIGSLACGAVLLAAFAAIELRRASPLLDLRLFRIPAFTGIAAIAFLQSVAIYPLFLFLALYFQDVLGYSPLEAGVRVLPVTLALFVCAPLSGRLTARIGLGPLMGLGLTVLGAGLLLSRLVEPGDDWTALLPGSIVGGAGMGIISPALAAAMVSVLPVERSGLASGINNTFRQAGIAAGIAGLGAIFQHHLARGPQDPAAFVAGLDAVFLVAAGCAFAAVPAALLLVRRA